MDTQRFQKDSGVKKVRVQVVSIGELLVEIMREKVDQPLGVAGTFVGPFASGAPAIFIDAVARLGINCGFVGTVGEDDFGRLIVERLEGDGVDATYIRSLSDYTTGVAFVTYFSDGSRKFIYHLSRAASGKIYEDQVDSDYLSKVKYLHIMGSSLSINEECRKACYKAATIVKDSGGKISFDPNLRPELLGIDKIREISEPILSSCEVVLPSGEEAKMLAGTKDAEDACQKILECGPEIVALKRGEKGSWVFTAKDKIKVASFLVKEIDPTGAGDCFDAGFVVGLLKGWPLEKAARFANAVGALAVTKKGPMEGAPTLEEVNRLLKAESYCS
jgi:sugar/nucleoside kinase (ribokinase family)